MSSIRVTTVVSALPAGAFEVFTDEIDQWWRAGPRFRWGVEKKGTLRFHDGVLEEVFADGSRFEVGKVLAWEPPRRLVFEFRARSFGPDETTEVEVTFEEVTTGTRVSVEHRGWDELPPDHPARHGLEGPAFTNLMGVWWADLLTAARVHAERA